MWLSIADAMGNSGSMILAALVVFAITINAAFYEAFPSTHLSVVLAGTFVLHLIRHPHILFCRETVLYVCFFAYMLVELSWTNDLRLATNTIWPAANFILVLVLVGSLVRFHNFYSVIIGFLIGSLTGAIAYTMIIGFPLVYPVEFSYNAVAGMYLFGLFLAMLVASFSRIASFPIAIALAFLSLTLATTSIKTNLGIVVGFAVAATVHFRHTYIAVFNKLGGLAVVVGILCFVVLTNDDLVERLENGVNRLSLGIQILQAREDLPGYSAFESRTGWLLAGLHGWVGNPLFGHGVEAFRSDTGITSHSTPIDLLYNSGLIGLVLFYSIFVSILWRLHRSRDERITTGRVLILGVTTCYLFISMSGTLHYAPFLAAFIGISVAYLTMHPASGAGNED